MSAGVEVKFSAEEQGGGSEEEDLVFWILVKIEDQVFRAVPDTSATLSIVARHLLNTFKKTRTVAIRVGDGRTIHSFGGANVSICLGNDSVMQHCRVLDTDAFDIVIGSDFLRRNPQGCNVVSPTRLCSTLQLWQWPLLRTFGAVRTKRVWAALRSKD